MSFADIKEKLTAQFALISLDFSSFRDNDRVVVPPSHIFEILSYLKTTFNFDMLIDLSAADYLHLQGATHRYGIWYAVLNVENGERIIVKTHLDDPDPRLPSVYDLWKGADWMEREVYDMFGIEFDGHPDLRRILLPDEFVAFPLRKDYPLRGMGERHNFQPVIRSES